MTIITIQTQDIYKISKDDVSRFRCSRPDPWPLEVVSSTLCTK